MPLLHPLMVARWRPPSTTSPADFAMNVVCGWFKNEFAPFGAHMRPHDDRYKSPPVARLRAAGWTEEEFDFDSELPPVRSGASQSRCRNRPPIMNAGGSPAAQDFTTRYCYEFRHPQDRTFLGRQGADRYLKRWRARTGRRIWIHVYVVCRETEKRPGLPQPLRLRQRRLGSGRQPPQDFRAAIRRSTRRRWRTEHFIAGLGLSARRHGGQIVESSASSPTSASTAA